METMLKVVKDGYTIEVGQILFLNGYGQNEHSHDRLAVYKIDNRLYHTVNLEKKLLNRKEIFTVRNIREKHGIGIYYKEGDTIDLETLNKAVVEATANEARISEDKDAEKARLEAERLGKIKIGSEKLKDIPDSVVSVIVALLKKDESDVMTDYFNHVTIDTVYLAFSTHTRDLFPEMRKAALNFEKTKHLGPGKGIFQPVVVIDQDFKSNGSYFRQGERSKWHDEKPEFDNEQETQSYIDQHPIEPINFEGVPIPFKWVVRDTTLEHREKYSMGEGYYLGVSKYNGWIVSKHNVSPKLLELLQIAIAEGRYFIPEAVKSKPIESGEHVEGVKAVQYSDKAIAVYGDTYSIKEELKANGGRFNRFLKINNQTVAGWVFQSINGYAQGLLTRFQ